MPKCEFCEVEVDFPFQCNYCGKYFCEAHRLLENHNCPNAPPRTPLGSYRTKVALTTITEKKEKKKETVQDIMPTHTYANKYHHDFSVPPEVYLDEKYYKKLNEARTLDEVEHIIHDYYKHYPKKSEDDSNV